ncbi:unnamed protein product, partial [Chrysoparadoxa australica]
DYCPHRGASFSDTKTSDGNLVCPYHGFKFSAASGELTEGAGSVPGCARLVPVNSLCGAGLLWVGEGEEPVFSPEEAEEGGYREVSGTSYVTATESQVAENILDVLHLASVHTFGNSLKGEPMDYRL